MDQRLSFPIFVGRTAHIATGLTRDGKYVAAAYWPNAAQGMTPGDTTAVSLTVIGIAADSLGQRDLLASLWSVRFRK